MLAGELNYYKALERDRRRPLGRTAHPDDCPRLLLHGVAFAVPPRRVRIVPSFGPEGVRLETVGGRAWPEMAELRKAIAALRKDKPCPTCGQPVGATVEIDLQRSARVMELAFALAAKALREQYELSDEELADLLAVSGDSAPKWLDQIVRYCHGLPTERSAGVSCARRGRTPRRGFFRRLLGR